MFETWLAQQMESRGIHSGRRFAVEASLPVGEVLEWLTGREVPSDDQCRQIPGYLGVDVAEVLAIVHPPKQAAGPRVQWRRSPRTA